MKRIWPAVVIGTLTIVAGAVAAWMLWQEITTDVDAIVHLLVQILEVS